MIRGVVTTQSAARDEQAKILHAIQRFTPEDVLHCAVRGQYGEGKIGGEAVPVVEPARIGRWRQHRRALRLLFP